MPRNRGVIHKFTEVLRSIRRTDPSIRTKTVDQHAVGSTGKTEFAGRGKVEISRFKGLGEMEAADLKKTTMDPKYRVLLRVRMPHRYVEEERQEARDTSDLVERLMGRKPELRFQFIQENAQFARDLDV